MPTKRAESFLPVTLEPLAPCATTDAEALLRKLSQLRRKGRALANEESLEIAQVPQLGYRVCPMPQYLGSIGQGANDIGRDGL